MLSKLAPRFGIVQGRLIQSPPGHLQWFPQDFWESEFFLAKSLNIDYIELISERFHNPSNPIWIDEGLEKIKELAEINNLTLHALCNDYIIEKPLSKSTEALTQSLELIERCGKLGCKKFILPLFESSELNYSNFKEFVAPLRTLADHAQKHELLLCLETIFNAEELMTVLEYINHVAVGVVYDTGNRVAFGHDLAGDIRKLGNRISHVHIKDKNQANENVLLGTGLVDFSKVFKALSDIEYYGPYTFETNRGSNALRTAKYNIDFVNFFISEAAAP